MNSDVPDQQLGLRHGFFTLKVQHRMAEMNVSIRDIAEEVGHTYEHIRKVVNGELCPSDEIVRIVGRRLKLDLRDLQQRAVRDRMLAEFGASAWRVSGIDPSLGPLYVLWEYLTDVDKRDIYDFTAIKKKRNRFGHRLLKVIQSPRKPRNG